MQKLITVAISLAMLGSSPALLAAASEDPHDPSNQAPDATDSRAEPQLDTGAPNPRSLGRTGRALPGTTDPSTNQQSDPNAGSMTGSTGSTGTTTTGTTDPATNLQGGSTTSGSTGGTGTTSSDPNAGSSDISDRLNRGNNATRQFNNRQDGSSNPASNVPATGNTSTNSTGAGSTGSTSTGTSATGTGTSGTTRGSTSGSGSAGAGSSSGGSAGGAR